MTKAIQEGGVESYDWGEFRAGIDRIVDSRISFNGMVDPLVEFLFEEIVERPNLVQEFRLELLEYLPSKLRDVRRFAADNYPDDVARRTYVHRIVGLVLDKVVRKHLGGGNIVVDDGFEHGEETVRTADEVGPVVAEVNAELVGAVGEDDMVNTPYGLYERDMMPEGYDYERPVKPGPERETRV